VEPCSLVRAFSTVDAQHPFVEMTTGTYRTGANLQGKTALVV